MNNLTIFLNSKDHVKTWIDGGIVPLKLASTYYSKDATGIYTPDENLVAVNTGVPIPLNMSMTFERPSAFNPPVTNRHPPGIYFGPKASMIVNDKIYDVANERYTGHYEDGLILCMTTRPTLDQMERFGGKEAAVEVVNLPELKAALDHQIGIISIAKSVSYTGGENRNHFLKSKMDEWQQEYRLFWPNSQSIGNCDVRIPKSVARELDLSSIPRRAKGCPRKSYL